MWKDKGQLVQALLEVGKLVADKISFQDLMGLDLFALGRGRQVCDRVCERGKNRAAGGIFHLNLLGHFAALLFSLILSFARHCGIHANSMEIGNAQGARARQSP